MCLLPFSFLRIGNGYNYFFSHFLFLGKVGWIWLCGKVEVGLGCAVHYCGLILEIVAVRERSVGDNPKSYPKIFNGICVLEKPRDRGGGEGDKLTLITHQIFLWPLLRDLYD